MSKQQEFFMNVADQLASPHHICRSNFRQRRQKIRQYLPTPPTPASHPIAGPLRSESGRKHAALRIAGE
jgi:hypothetical protein